MNASLLAAHRAVESLRAAGLRWFNTDAWNRYTDLRAAHPADAREIDRQARASASPAPVTPKPAPAVPAPKPLAKPTTQKKPETTADLIKRAYGLLGTARKVIAAHGHDAPALSSGLSNMSGRGAELDAAMGVGPVAQTPAAPRLVGCSLQFGPAAAPAGAINRARLEQQAKMDRSMGVPAARCEVRRPDGRVEIGASLTPAEIELARANGCKVRQMAEKVGA